MKLRATSLAIFLTLLTLCPAFGLVPLEEPSFEEFSLKTFDGLSVINGQIDFPTQCERRSYKTVFIIGGTGLYYRNMYIGLSGTPQDFVAKDLAQILTSNCLAVVRFDYRGVTCDITTKDLISTCLDQEIRRDVDAQTILDDIELVYDYARNHDRIDKNNIVINAFSEGSLNVGRLVKKKKINPKGLVFVGGITESPKSLVRWQFIDRSVDFAFNMDTNGNGILSNYEIIDAYPNSFFEKNDVPLLSLMSPTGVWDRYTLNQYFSGQYATIVNSVLIAPAHLPYRHKQLIYSNMGWWKTWFTDREPVISKLAKYRGPITYFNGTLDIQAPGRRQLSFLKNYTGTLVRRPRFNVIEGKGHLLSDHPEFGPIDPAQKAKVIRAIKNSF